MSLPKTETWVLHLLSLFLSKEQEYKNVENRIKQTESGLLYILRCKDARCVVILTVQVEGDFILMKHTFLTWRKNRKYNLSKSTLLFICLVYNFPCLLYSLKLFSVQTSKLNVP